MRKIWGTPPSRERAPVGLTPIAVVGRGLRDTAANINMLLTRTVSERGQVYISKKPRTQSKPGRQ